MSKSTALSADTTLFGAALATSSDEDGFALARRLAAPIWVFDIDKMCVAYANKPACQFWQADTEEELVSRDMSVDMSETVASRLRQYQNDFSASDAVFNEMWTLYPNGVPSSVMVYFRSFHFKDGRVGMLCEVSGEAHDTPENLRSIEALLHTDVMIGLFSQSGVPLYLNPAARTLLVKGDQRLSELFFDPSDYAQMMLELSLSGDNRLVARAHTKSGERWFDMSAKNCLDAVTGDQAILLTAIDVSELKNARDTARYLADRDQLTGTYNRAFLQQHIMDMQDKPGLLKCALLYFDVDRFKLINDTLGHEMGDTVLKTIANRAIEAVRDTDILARLGGDEFVILLKDINNAGNKVLREAERIRDQISRNIALPTARIDVGVSMGVTVFDPAKATFTEIMREADLALYASKSDGRGRCSLFDEALGKAAHARDMLELELKSALQSRDFELHYQPRLDIRQNRVIAVEGLLRWNHPDRGLIMPDTFIPICEENGLIDDLGQIVLEIGCQQAAIWAEKGLRRGVSLNISPRQFNDDRLISILRRYADQTGFPSNLVELEITENVLIGDPELIANKLRAITRMGYRIAIDDFGTGYSNLSYISRFPVHCIKIDRTFIDQLPQSAPIVGLILTLARQIGAQIVAEGVETMAQMEWLAANGCDQVQGYLLSKPVTINDLPRVIAGLDRRPHAMD